MKRIALLIEVEVSDSEDSMFKPREIGERFRQKPASFENRRVVTAWRSGEEIPDLVSDAILATGMPS